jgi:hypothetical protein
MVAPIPLLFWHEDASFLSHLGVVSLAAVFAVGLAAGPIARYRRATGRKVWLERVLIDR